MTEWAEVTFKDGHSARIDIEAIAGLDTGQALNIHRDSQGILWAAPISRLDSDRDRAIETDPRTLNDFTGCPDPGFDRAVWLRLMEEGEAAIAGLFPTRREVLEARGEWPTRDD